MSYNGSGLFTNPFNWNNDKTNNIKITASRMQTQDDGIATGLSTAICKDGQQVTTAIIPFAVGLSTVAGSAAAPSVAIMGDLTTGVYQSASGAIDFTSAGTRCGGFTATGLNNTVIGATTPAAMTVTTINKVTVTAPASGSTLTIANGKTLTVNSSVTLAGGDASILAIAASKTLTVSNTMTLAGGDSTVMTFPNSTDTVVTLAASQTLTGKTLTSPLISTVLGGSSSGSSLTLQSTSASGSGDFIKALVGNNGATEAWRVNGSGDFLVGTTSTDVITGQTPGLTYAKSTGIVRLFRATGEVMDMGNSTSGADQLDFYYTTAKIGSIVNNGTTGITYNTSSDVRLKKDIVPIENSGPIIDALKPVHFKMKSDDSDHAGFIAQDFYEVLPEFVCRGDDDEAKQQGDEGFKPWSMDRSGAMAYVIAELKSLRARVKELENK